MRLVVEHSSNMNQLKDMCCNSFFRKTAGDLAEQYGGAQARTMLDGAFSQIGGEEADKFSGKQLNHLEGFLGMLNAGGGQKLKDHIQSKGIDPSLIDGVMNLIGQGKAAPEDVDGGVVQQDAEGKFDPSQLLSVVSSLTMGGGQGGGGMGGFMKLLGGSNGSTMQNIIDILQGLGKSFFNVKRNSDPAVQDWDQAQMPVEKDKNFLNWAMSILMDLLFPGKKPKAVIEERKDDDINPDKKKDPEDLKKWFDGHPEIGKMQKDIFDDIFDTTDDDKEKTDDDVPLVPVPRDFEPGSSCLDDASILFLNTNLLLEYRRDWRFLYSSRTHDRSLEAMTAQISWKGPTLVIVKDDEGHMFGAHCSTSWAETQDDWVGNGECFLFSIMPKMAIFHSTGKNENYQSLSGDRLAMGEAGGEFGLELKSDLSAGSSSGNVETFDTIQLSRSRDFNIDHIEVWGLGPQPDADDERRNFAPRRPNLTITGGNADVFDLDSQMM